MHHLHVLSLVLAIYAAVVATSSLLFNYFKEPTPLMHLALNSISWEMGRAYWEVSLRNLGAGSARHVKVRVRRGATKWSEWTMLTPIVEPKNGAIPRNDIARSLELDMEEYAALASDRVRATWRMQFQWVQGPLALVGRRRRTVRPDSYWTREQSETWG